MLSCSRFLEVHTYYSDCRTFRRIRRLSWLLDEIQWQPSVRVLSGPATVITNIAAAGAFLPDEWSTESVSRVVRTRTRQENNERKRAEHVYYSHIHGGVTISDSFAVTGPGFEEDENLTKKKQQHRMTKKMKQNSPYRLAADTMTNFEDS